jgi:hypothetical protein
MKGTGAGIGAALLVVVLGWGGWQLLMREPITPSALSVEVPYTGSPLTDEYKNDRFRFSLAIPEGYTVGELPHDDVGGTPIIIQNEQGEGIQIYIVPAEAGDKVLTIADIQANIPELQIEASEPVAIGADYQGVAFLSDNDAYGGASREVWFYFRGNLYQISTYAQLDTLLKAMFATWKFY